MEEAMRRALQKKTKAEMMARWGCYGQHCHILFLLNAPNATFCRLVGVWV
jgi:hypothetical protein